MTEQIISNAVENGSDTAAIGGVITYLLFAGFLGYLVLTLRDLRRKGMSLASGSSRSTRVRTMLATGAIAIVIVLGLIGIVYTALVWRRYQADRAVLASGGFQSISGSLDEYRAVEVRRNGRQRILDNTPGFPPTLHERDRLVVGGRTYFVRCDKLPEASAGAVGEEGKCVDLHVGQKVKIDFMQLSPTQNRSEPLRITIVQSSAAIETKLTTSRLASAFP